MNFEKQMLVLKKVTHKKINTEISEIENFLDKKDFIIRNEGFPIDKCLFNVVKEDKLINFTLKLKESLFPKDITFKKLGFNQDFKIESDEVIYIIPSKCVTKISSKIISSETINGKLNEIYSESFPFKKKSTFRLFLQTNEELITTIFLGSEYSCNQIQYSLGLVELNVDKITYHIYRYEENNKNYLIIESLDGVFFEDFKNTCESTLKSIGFLIGNWYQEDYYFFAYDSKNFEKPFSIYYKYLGKSIISKHEIINPRQFKIFIETETEKIKLSSVLFPEKILSTIVSFSIVKPEFERTIELIIEGNNTYSPLVRCSVFSVALETIVSLIHSENKGHFKPMKQSKELEELLKKLQSTIDNDKSNFTESAHSFLSKKIQYLNTPFNKDKYLLAFNFYNIALPLNLEKLLNVRNKFFHGKTPYKEGLLKTKIKELNLEADRLHMLVSILVLKYVGYRGHIKNQAGYRIEVTNKFEENINLDVEESAFYRI